MTVLDLPTVLVLHQSSLVVGAASLLLLWMRAERPAGVLRIAIGLVALAGGATLAGLGRFAVLASDLWIETSLALSLTGFLLVMQGAQELDAPTRWHWALLLLGPAIALQGFFGDDLHDERLRALIFHAGGALALLVAGFSVAARRRVDPLPSRLPLATCLLAGAFVYGLQIDPLVLGLQPAISMTTGLALTLSLNYGIAAFVTSLVRERKEAHHGRVAKTDPLTGAANRRGFFDKAPPDPAPGDSLLAIDLDRFKRLNDRFGHAAGDHALRVVARLVERRLGRDDVFARFGGEEFVIYMPGPQAGRAVRIAEEIRAAIGGEEIVWKNRRLPVTVSVGLCVVGSVPIDWACLSEGADRALYAAKAAGRDRVSIDIGTSDDASLPAPADAAPVSTDFASPRFSAA